MKKFKAFLKEAKIYSHNPDGSKKINNINSINYIHSDLQKAKGFNNLVKVSDSFHDNYKKSGDYISVTGINDKYSNKNIRNLLSNNMNVEYPEVSICPKGSINFTNGQHRYGLSHRIGQEKMVTMNSESCSNAKKYGYIS